MKNFTTYVSQQLKSFEDALSRSGGNLSSDELKALAHAVHSITHSRIYKNELKRENKEKIILLKEIQKAEKAALKAREHK